MFGKFKQSEEYRSSLKSMDTEEWFDLNFYRPLGYGWALLARRLGIPPNAVTVASIFLGVGAGVCFYFDSLAINILGVFLLPYNRQPPAPRRLRPLYQPSRVPRAFLVGILDRKSTRLNSSHP